MKYRWSELLASETIAAAATKTIDIDLADPISRINVLVKLTNNGSVPTDHPAKAISKLEVVDGSDVLFSLNGMEIQALNFYERRQPAFGELIYLNDVMTLLEFDINFGRWLWDPMLALDPRKFKNPQLRITHNLALGGSAPDSMDLRVRADLFDKKTITPVGFLTAKEHYSYALASSGNEYVDLPTDYPVKMLMLMSRAASKAPHEQYNQIRLTEDQDKVVVAEGYISDFTKVLAGMFPAFQERLYGGASAAGVAHFITPTLDCFPSLNAEGTSAQIYAEAFVNGGTKTIHGDVTANFHGIYTGYCPHGAVAFPMGSPDDNEDWWDVTQLGSARIKITAGSSVEASSTAQVVLQQLRRYQAAA